jgi:hypothetical protein
VIRPDHRPWRQGPVSVYPVLAPAETSEALPLFVGGSETDRGLVARCVPECKVSTGCVRRNGALWKGTASGSRGTQEDAAQRGQISGFSNKSTPPTSPFFHPTRLWYLNLFQQLTCPPLRTDALSRVPAPGVAAVFSSRSRRLSWAEAARGGVELVEKRKRPAAINGSAPLADPCPTRRGRRGSASCLHEGRLPARSRRPRWGW